MTTYVSGLPPIVCDILDMPKGAQRVVLYVESDPVTGVEMFCVYTDDGHGNGNCIVALPVVELNRVARELKAA